MVYSGGCDCTSTPTVRYRHDMNPLLKGPFFLLTKYLRPSSKVYYRFSHKTLRSRKPGHTFTESIKSYFYTIENEIKPHQRMHPQSE